MTKRTCRVDDCDRSCYAKNLCRAHYDRMRIRGTTEPLIRTRTVCSAEGCDSLGRARGLCSMHYQRLMKTGSVEPPKRYTPEEAKRRSQESQQAYKERNRELIRKRARDRYQANAEAERERNRRYHALNADKVAELNRRWRAANRERHHELTKKWYRENPERAAEIWRDKSGRRREQIKSTRTGPIDYQRLLEESQMICYLCNESLPGEGGLIHWDHVIPLSRGGTHTQDNIRPTHEPCNLKKGAKILAASGPEYPVAPEGD